MDPNATLAAFLEACRDDERDEALEALDNLREWIVKGGFLPLCEPTEHCGDNGVCSSCDA